MRRVVWRGAALSAVLVLLLSAALLSPAGRDGNGETDVAEAKMETVRSGTGLNSDEIGEGSFQVQLSEEEELLLKELLRLMESGALDRAATVMDENEETLREVILVTFGGRRYLYGAEGICEEIEGRGMVLTSPSVLFYGNFADGVPEGRVTALQEVVLEAPRYDYSIGEWSGGRMNGYGVTGYFYYKGSGELDGRKTERAGIFAEDRLEGTFRYTVVDRNGDSTTWNIDAKDGVTCLDERWRHEEEKSEYYLPAQGEEGHLYVLKAGMAEEVLWKNRIVWE